MGEGQPFRDLLGTNILFQRWQCEGAASGGVLMRSGRKKHELSDWRLTMEQMGRELGKIYRRPQRVPRRLRILLREFEKSEIHPLRTLIRKTEPKGPDEH